MRLKLAVTAAAALATLLFAGGAMAATTTLSATLSGTAEVPGPGDPNGGGSARITIDVAAGRVCWNLRVSNITLPAAAAHIHLGAAGVAGPIIVPLSPPGANGRASGCATGVARATARAIANDPSSYYVNVHTSDFPNGAVRGQLRRAAETFTLASRGGSFAFVDNPPKSRRPVRSPRGPQISAGDVFVISEPYFRGGRRVGRLDVVCTATRGGRTFVRATFHCTGTARLGRGTLALDATFRGQPTRIAITGGTGIYEGASGSIRTREGRGDTSFDTFHILLP